MRGAPDEFLIGGTAFNNSRFHSSSRFNGMNETT